MEILKAQAGINMLHVPYRGLAPVQTALVAGEVQAAILGFGTSRSMIDAGRLRIIAIASSDRVKSMPDVPTTGESGYPRVDATSRLTLAGPARMSEETIARVNDAVSRALASPELRKQIEAREIVVTNMGPKPLAEIIQRLTRLNGEAVKIAELSPNSQPRRTAGAIGRAGGAVTGCGPNINGGIAYGLADEGAKVVCIDLRADYGQACAQAIRKRGGQAAAVVCDVTREDDIVVAIKQAEATFGPIDVLINGAVLQIRKGLLEVSLDEIRRQLDVGLCGAMLFTKHAARSMIEHRRRGSVINIGSTEGHQGNIGNIAYGTAKGGSAALHPRGGDGTCRVWHPREQPVADRHRPGGGN